MSTKGYWLLIIAANSLFLLADRFLKHFSLYQWSNPQLWHGLAGWEPSLNPGVAFSLPVPNQVVVILTVPILLILGWLLFVAIKNDQKINQWALGLIILGALSNLIDRVLYHHTIDYLRLLTMVINLADLMITGGFVLYLLKNFQKKT